MLELGGKTATGIEVPADVVAALGSTKRPAVQVTINGHADAVAAQRFTALSYSNQRAHVPSVEGAKAAETRARRVTKGVDTLLAD